MEVQSVYFVNLFTPLPPIPSPAEKLRDFQAKRQSYHAVTIFIHFITSRFYTIIHEGISVSIASIRWMVFESQSKFVASAADRHRPGRALADLECPYLLGDAGLVRHTDNVPASLPVVFWQFSSEIGLLLLSKEVLRCIIFLSPDPHCSQNAPEGYG